MMRYVVTVAVIAGWGCAGEVREVEPWVHTFGPFEVEAGGEESGLCVSWTLGNEEFLYVNRVEMRAGFGFHHSNWFFVDDSVYGGPDGVWPCEERGYSEAVAATTGGVLFAQSTQATHEVQAFDEGIAIPVPPRSRIVGGLHLLNASAEPLVSDMTLELHPIAEEEVDTFLSGMSLQWVPLAIPPGRDSVFTSECDFRAEHERQLGRALDFSIYYVLPHYHDLGTGMEIEVVGPDGAREELFANESAIGEPLGKVLEVPVSMEGKASVRYSCSFSNPRGETVGWGIGDQEMCVFLAFTDSELLWGGGVMTGEAPAPRMEDGVPHFERECTLFSFPASHFL